MNYYLFALLQIYRLVVVQVEAAEAAKKEAEKAKKKSLKKPGGNGKNSNFSSHSRKDGRKHESVRRNDRSRSRDEYRRDYDHGTILSTKSQSGSVAVIIRPVRGRACIEEQRLISTEDGLVYSPMSSRATIGRQASRQLSPEQAFVTRETQWKYQKVKILKKVA